MDPLETLKRWRKAVAAGDRSEAAEFAGYLRDWLARGGFEPTWADAKERAKFVRHVARGGDVLDPSEMARLHERKNPTGMSLVESLAWGLAAAGALYLIFRPSTASAAIVPATGGQTPARPTSSSPVVGTMPPISSPNATAPTSGLTAADHEAIRAVQDRLRAIGYQPGPSTGDWNHDTNYALAYFQRAEGLPANGVLNGTTAMRLAAVYERKLQQQNDDHVLPRSLDEALANERETWTTIARWFS